MDSAWMEFKAEVIAQYQEQKNMADAAFGRVDDGSMPDPFDQAHAERLKTDAPLAAHMW